MLVFAFTAKDSHALMKQPTPSAQLVPLVEKKQVDERVVKLRTFLNSQNSPMAKDAEAFVKYADQYNLDWKLVVSIAGLESGYGKHVPAGSYNGWGWGYSNGTVMHFSSWEEGIEAVSKGLRQNYIDRGANDVYAIGRIYAASPTWATRVQYFMNKLETFDQATVEEPRIAVAL